MHRASDNTNLFDHPYLVIFPTVIFSLSIFGLIRGGQIPANYACSTHDDSYDRTVGIKTWMLVKASVFLVAIVVPIICVALKKIFDLLQESCKGQRQNFRTSDTCPCRCSGSDTKCCECDCCNRCTETNITPVVIISAIIFLIFNFTWNIIGSSLFRQCTGKFPSMHLQQSMDVFITVSQFTLGII
jgi:H+/gluconate symporter-like permease